MLKSLVNNYISYAYEAYKKHRYLFIEKVLKDVLINNNLCFDIGAHIGVKTDYLLKLGARVISVEPQSNSFKELQQKFSTNNSVILVNKAVSSECRSVGFISICDDRPSVSSLSEEWVEKSRFSKDFQWNRKEEVSLITLDELIRIHGVPSYCKIDVEGYETEVLKGLTSTIELISFEFNVEILENAIKCSKQLDRVGRYCYNLSFGDEKYFRMRNWTTISRVINYISSNHAVWGDIYAKRIS